jgi:hypothetical protein
VPDDLWAEAAAHFNEQAFAALILSIAVINVWNRLNVATHQVAGPWEKSPEARKWVEAGTSAVRQVLLRKSVCPKSLPLETWGTILVRERRNCERCDSDCD